MSVFSDLQTFIFIFAIIFLNYSPVSDSLYIPLVSIVTTSPYISQRVHFPVLNFVTYNFMYVFCLQLFPVFWRIHVYNSLIIRRRKSIIQQLRTSLFRLSDQLWTFFFTVTHITPFFLTADFFVEPLYYEGTSLYFSSILYDTSIET